MKVKKEIREERNDVYGFYEEKEIVGVNGSVMVEEKIDESTLTQLTEKQNQLTKEIEVVNEKIRLIELWEAN
jgi:prefoldin subunit 5